MKIYQIVFFTLLSVSLFAQEKEAKDKPFASSCNRYYIGASVSPIVVSLLNSNNIAPEWKFAYKQRLTQKNHYFRLSYSYLNTPLNSYRYNYGYWYNGGYDYTYTTTLNDSMEWVSGTRKNVNNNHVVKVGYEYQFKVGSKRSASINLGMDALIGFHGGKTFSINDTITYRDVISGGYPYRNIEDYRSNTEVLSRANVYYGFSPVIAFGVPLKKRFDLSFEMAVDLSFSGLDRYPYYGSALNVNYRPTVMLSYRFDECVTRNTTRNKSSKRK